MFTTVHTPLNLTVGWNPTILPSFEVSVVIPIANYTTGSLSTLLKTLIDVQIQLVSPNYAVTVVYNNIQSRFVFTSSGSSAATIGFSPQNTDTNELIGISDNEDVVGFISPHQMGNASNIFGPKDVMITSSVLSGGFQTIESSGRFLKTIAHIPIVGVYGSYVQYIPQIAELNSVVFPESKNISEIDLQVRDDSGRILDLQGLHWEVTLKLYY
jgi:hypothetical protein